MPERDRLARSDRDLPHLQRTQRLDRWLDVILFTDRDTARGEHQIGLLRGLTQRRLGCGQGIFHDAQFDHLTPQRL